MRSRRLKDLRIDCAARSSGVRGAFFGLAAGLAAAIPATARNSANAARRKFMPLEYRVGYPDPMSRFVVFFLTAAFCSAQESTADLNRQVSELRELVLKLQARIDDLE